MGFSQSGTNPGFFVKSECYRSKNGLDAFKVKKKTARISKGCLFWFLKSQRQMNEKLIVLYLYCLYVQWCNPILG
jgi:hypothetical protein